jgi:hypothetical protein
MQLHEHSSDESLEKIEMEAEIKPAIKSKKPEKSYQNISRIL